jgi:hypothetical protein
MVKLFAALLVAGSAFAQTADVDPAPALQPDENHILGVVPIYNTVETPKPFQRLSAGGKFQIAAQDSFDPYTWVITGLYAGAEQWNRQDKEFGQGAAGFAKRYGALFADQAISTYMTEAIIPVWLHEDPRFFRLGEGTFWKRTGYAMTRVLVTRTDQDRRRFNTSEIAGNMIGAAVGDLYHAPSERGLGEVLERFAVSVISDSGFNVLKEFWPDMRHKVLKR